MTIRVPVIIDAVDSDLARTISQDVEQGGRGADRVGRQIGTDLGRGISQTLGSSLDGVDQEFASTGRDAGKSFSNGFAATADAGAPAAADGFTGKLSGSLKAGLAGVAIAAAAALTAGFIGAMEKEKQVDRITATLALTDAQAARAGEVAGSLYAGAWGDSMQEVTTAVEAVISSIEGMASASTSELEAVTASILDIATAFDLDVSEAARNAGILIRTGLAKDATEAADLITRSLQEVPAALRGGIVDATEEYAQFFAAVGFDGPQALGLLTSALQSGQFGVDRMGDALKEFTIRATELDDETFLGTLKALGIDARQSANDLLAGGETANKAFTTIVNGLRSIDDPAEQAAAAVAVFGTPLEDLGKSEIPAFLNSLVSTESALAGVEGAAASMGDTLNDNVATRLESIKRGAETLLTEGIGALFTAFDQGGVVVARLGESFQGTVQAFEPVRKAFVELATEAATRLGPVFAEVGAKIQNELLPALNEFGQAIAPIVEFIVQNIGPRVTQVFESLGITLGGLVDIITGVFSTIAAVIRGDWSGAWDGVLTILEGALGVIEGALNVLLSIFGTSLADLQTNVLQAWGNIRRFFTEGNQQLLNAVRDLGNNLVVTFVNFQTRIISGISGWISNLVGQFGFLGSSLITAARNMWSSAQSAFSNGISTIVSIAGSGLGNVVGAFRALPGQITQALGNLGNLLYGAGQNVIQGLINGIISMINRVRSSMSSIASTIRSYLPFSPAKVGPLSGSGNPEASGQKIIEMLSAGLESRVSLPARAMNTLLAPLAPSGSQSVFPGAGTSSGFASGAEASSAVTINQNFFGPTTSGGRLQEMNWTTRYATQARTETVGGVAT